MVPDRLAGMAASSLVGAIFLMGLVVSAGMAASRIGRRRLPGGSWSCQPAWRLRDLGGAVSLMFGGGFGRHGGIEN